MSAVFKSRAAADARRPGIPAKETEEGNAAVPKKLKNPVVRVSIALEKDADPDAVIAAIEHALGHELAVVWRIRTGNVLAVDLPEKEIPAVRLVEGVHSVKKDAVNELHVSGPASPHAAE